MQVLSLPFAATNEHVSSIDWNTTYWGGTLDQQFYGEYIDFWFLLLLGGVPWQAYFQRALSA